MNSSTDSEMIMPSNLGFPVVGIGASAGGLNAIMRFFEYIPQNVWIAFVIVVHLSPKHESNGSRVRSFDAG